MPGSRPFDGYKRSGIGRANSRAALDHYSQIESVNVKAGVVEARF